MHRMSGEYQYYTTVYDNPNGEFNAAELIGIPYNATSTIIYIFCYGNLPIV